MRYLSSMITATLISSGALSASADTTQLCGDALLDGTAQQLYGALHVSPLQARQLEAIRTETTSYRQWLQSELDRVRRAQRRSAYTPVHPTQQHALQQQEASLTRQLEQQPARAAARAVAVLAPWQRDQCAQPDAVSVYWPAHARPRPAVRRIPPVRIVRAPYPVTHHAVPRYAVRAPRPVVDRTPPRVILREAPPRERATIAVAYGAPRTQARVKVTHGAGVKVRVRQAR